MNWGNFFTTALLVFGFTLLHHSWEMDSETWKDWLRTLPSSVIGWALLSGAVSRLAL